jgi:glycosyltransferase involved in cell wall biosynthesis
MAPPPESQSESPPPLGAEAERLGVGIVIPAFDPGSEIADLLRELGGLMGLSRVVVIDDGSGRTEHFDSLPPAAQVVHAEHGGKGSALQHGFAWGRERGWRWAICMDCDGQHSPQDLPTFFAAIGRGDADIILGNRMDNVETMPWLRCWTNRTTSRIISHMAGQPVPDAQSGYRAIRLAILNAFPLVTHNYDTESELLLRASWKGFRIRPVPIRTIYRGDEESHIHKFRDTMRFLHLVRSARHWRHET